jgi:hypothetical protein
MVPVEAYGAVGNDSTDDTTAFNNAIAAVNTAGGGTICGQPGKTYLINGQLLLPNDAMMVPNQNNFRITGCGGGGQRWNDPSNDTINGVGAVVLDMRYQGDWGKIETEGAGALVIDNLTFKDGSTAPSYSVTGGTLTSIVVAGNVATVTFPSAPSSGMHPGSLWSVSGSTTSAVNTDCLATAATSTTLTCAITVANGTYNNAALTLTYSAPFIRTTNTTLTVRDNVFVGNASAPQSAVTLGGWTPTIGSDPNDAFQGYTSVIERNLFRALGRGVLGLTYANAVVIKDNSWGVAWSGLAGFQCYGDVANVNTGWIVTGNTVEAVNSMLYFGELTNCRTGTFSNSHYDGGVQFISAYNLTNSVNNSITILEDDLNFPRAVTGDSASLKSTTLYNSIPYLDVYSTAGPWGNVKLDIEGGSVIIRNSWNGNVAYEPPLWVGSQANVAYGIGIGFDDADTQARIETTATLCVNCTSGVDIHFGTGNVIFGGLAPAQGLISYGSGVTNFTGVAPGSIRMLSAASTPPYLSFAENAVAFDGTFGFAAGGSALQYYSGGSGIFGSGTLAWSVSASGVTTSLGAQTTEVAVASLPTCNGGAAGQRASVNNSNAVSFTAGIGAVVAAGGTTHVPVYCDGTNWRIG